MALLGFSLAGLLGALLVPPLPPADYPSDTVLLDGRGQPLRIRTGPGDVDCRPIPLDAMGNWAAQAMIAAEDKRFYRHPGVDPIAILRALAVNLAHGRVMSGASTLTTQVIKLRTPRPRTLRTKILEAVDALRLEMHTRKNDILEQYLNRAPFGSNLTGVESASLRYFGKHAADLSLSEAALLAAMPKAPSRLRPDRHPARARRRRDDILRRMLANGMIDRRQFETALQEPLRTRMTPPPFQAPHFCDLVLQTTHAAGHLTTTLDARLQETVSGIMRRHGDLLKQQGVYGGAVVVLEVRTGAVRVMIGSPDYTDNRHAGQVNGATARRSPGSALKPFVYAMAFDEGRCTPATILRDEPLRFRQWDPENFNRAFSGPVMARDALVRSLNIPALELTRQVTVPRLLARLRQLGLSTLNRPADVYGLGLILGGGEVTLLDLVNAYAALARNGEYRPYRLLEDRQAATPSGLRLFSAEAAYLTHDILSGDERIRELQGHVAESRLPRIAWKTGTSAGFKDAWTLAYNPDYAVGVWIGNPDGRPLPDLTGGSAAAPIAGDIFRELYPDGRGPWFERPDGLATRAVCARTGKLPTAACKEVVDDDYLPGISRCDPCDAAHAPDADEAPEPARRALAISSPADGETYTLLRDWPAGRQELPLIADAGGATNTLYWFVDGRLTGTCAPGETAYWPLEPGRRTIACADAAGRRATAAITVE